MSDDFAARLTRLAALCKKPVAQAVLEGLSDEDACHVALGRAIELLGPEPDRWEWRLDRLTTGQEVVLHVLGLSGLVGNGGFYCYFEEVGSFPLKVVPALRLLGAEQNAVLVERAIASVMKQLPPKVKRLSPRAAQDLFASDEYDESELEEIQEAFFALQKTEDIDALCIQYIRAHPEDFTR